MKAPRSILRTISFCLIATLLFQVSASARLDSKKASYQGGTTKDKDFPGAKEGVVGELNLANETHLRFEYLLGKESRVYSIPYESFIDIEYGQKAGRRVGAAIATAILISPVGLFLLFSKKRKHFVTIGYKNEQGGDEVVVFELGKDLVRTALPILKARSGKEIEYQDEEAKKASKGE